jgi:hypothetical protein
MSRGRRDERGAVLVLTAILLVVMLGLSALVVDLGFARSQRRKMQNATDSAALGAAQWLATANEPQATLEAKNLGDKNLSQYAPLAWGTVNCDPGHLAVLSSSSPCVSYDTSFTQVRVRVPHQTFPSLFGKIFNNNGLGTSTTATAQIASLGNGGILPFMVTSGFGSGEACLDSGGGGGSIPPCNGPITGNFGWLDFHQYGSPVLNTASSCSNGGTSARLTDNIAMGADHNYSIFAGTAKDDDCAQLGPNTVSSGTGNGNSFDEGILGGHNFSDGEDARLQRLPAGFTGWETTTNRGDVVDNRPLWEFIDPTFIPGVPGSCQRATFDTLLIAVGGLLPAVQQAALHAALATCINDYVAAGSTTPIFTAKTPGAPKDHGQTLYDIQWSSRFVHVPQMVQPDFTCSGYCYNIAKFRAVFLQRLLQNNGSQMDFEPGPWNGGSVPGNKAQAVTAFVLPDTMLPGHLGSLPVAIGENATIELVG